MTASAEPKHEQLAVQPLRETVRAAVIAAIAVHNDNMSEAARALGIDRRTLYRIVARERIPRPRQKRRP